MNILLVDDSRTIRFILAKMLNELGYTDVYEADSAKGAKELLAKVEFGLIFSDWHMPGESGLDLLKYVRGNKPTEKVPYIMVTTEHEKKRIVEAVTFGLQAYMLKPVDKKSMVEKLESLAASHGIQKPGGPAGASAATEEDPFAVQQVLDGIETLGFGQKMSAEVGQNNYPVFFGHSNAASLPPQVKELYPQAVFTFVTDNVVEEKYKDQIADWEKELGFQRHRVPAGQDFKTVDSWGDVVSRLADSMEGAQPVIIAFGGCAVMELAAFAASTVKKGLPLVTIPTTWKAMVHASAGGRAALNCKELHNLVTADYHPSLVWVDTSYLDSMIDLDFQAGYAECFRYGFVGGRALFDAMLDTHGKVLEKDPEALQEVLARSVALRMQILNSDLPQESKDGFLQFGGNFASAIMDLSAEGSQVRFGDALYKGIQFSVELGRQVGTVDPSRKEAYGKMLEKTPSEISLGSIDLNKLYARLLSGRATGEKTCGLVVPDQPGRAVVKSDIPNAKVMEALKAILA